MKNHTNACNIMCGSNGTCTCSFENQPGMDIVQLLNTKGDLERECDSYINKLEEKRIENLALEQALKDLSEYPWGAMWTYWFTAMIAGGACMVGLIVGQWLFS